MGEWDVKTMKTPDASGPADDLFDPVNEPGDAGVDAVVVWVTTAFAPAHHASQEPATRWLLADQRTTRVPLAERDHVDFTSTFPVFHRTEGEGKSS